MSISLQENVAILIRDVPKHLSGTSLVEFVSLYIEEHQRNFPSAWQEWCIEKRAKELAARLNAAFREKEYSIPRIILLFN